MELQAVLHIQAVGGIRQLHRVGCAAPRMHLDDRQATFAQAEDEGVPVETDAFQHACVVVPDQLAPVLAARLCFARGIQGEVDAGLVAAHEPGPLAVQQAVVDVVLVVLLAWRQAAELASGRVGIQHPGLAGGLATQAEHQLALGAGAMTAEEEASVGFLEHQIGACAAERMAIQAMRAVGVVQGDEEQGPAVVGPGHLAVAVVERQLVDVAVAEVLDEQAVDLVAAGVQAVAE